mgnify:CR=1 FL=1
MEVAIFLYEVGNMEFKVSLRSKEQVDVSKVASYFGGGGHVKAAGCTVEGPAEEAIERILAEVEKRL